MEIHQGDSRLLGQVLVNKVARLGEHLQGVFSCKRQLASSHPNSERRTDIPCICPIVNSVSNRSVPASNNIFPPLASRNFLLSPTNQPSQNGCVAARSVFHTHG